MEGRAVPTGVSSRAGITREVAFSRKVMDEILETGGWLKANPVAAGARAADRADHQPHDHLQPAREPDPGVVHRHQTPARAHDVTKRFAELIIKESLATKERESREAYEFIDSQVRQYHKKLTDAEAKLEVYRKANPDARPGIDGDVNSRIGELRRMVDSSRMELMDPIRRASALTAQLNGENEISVVQTRCRPAAGAHGGAAERERPRC